VLRRATSADAATLAAIHGRAVLLAYEDFVPYDELTRYDQGELTAHWSAVAGGSIGHQVLVAATADDVPRGFVVFGASRDADRPRDGELSTLYVDPPAQGAGLGGELHGAALDALRDSGFTDAGVWVYEENGHARGFYERLGWELDAGPRQFPGWSRPQVRYRRSLAV